MNLFEEIMVTMAKVEAENKNRKKVKRKRLKDCAVCGHAIYNLNPKDDPKKTRTFTIIKGSKDYTGEGRFAIVSNPESHNCIVYKPTRFTAELFIEEMKGLLQK